MLGEYPTRLPMPTVGYYLIHSWWFGRCSRPNSLQSFFLFWSHAQVRLNCDRTPLCFQCPQIYVHHNNVASILFMEKLPKTTRSLAPFYFLWPGVFEGCANANLFSALGKSSLFSARLSLFDISYKFTNVSHMFRTARQIIRTIHLQTITFMGLFNYSTNILLSSLPPGTNFDLVGPAWVGFPTIFGGTTVLWLLADSPPWYGRTVIALI